MPRPQENELNGRQEPHSVLMCRDRRKTNWKDDWKAHSRDYPCELISMLGQGLGLGFGRCLVLGVGQARGKAWGGALCRAWVGLHGLGQGLGQ